MGKRRKVSKVIFVMSMLIFIWLSGNAQAFFEKEGDTFRFDIPTIKGWKTLLNLYWDLEFTHMGDMPMKMTTTDNMGMQMDMIGSMKKQNFLDQKHMNIILDTKKDRLRLHGNFQTTHLFNAGSQEYAIADNNQSKMLEYYGDYTFNDYFKVRLGKFLSPFGLYNDIRYLTPLYATVVLPFIYETPNSYGHESLYPPDSNLMFYGHFEPMEETEVGYNIYFGWGKRNLDSIRPGTAMTVGFHPTISYANKYKLGLSVYTVNVNPDTEGREVMEGIDLEIGPFKGASIQAEFVKGERKLQATRYAYNARLTYDLGALSKSWERFTPYIMIDQISDREDTLFIKKENRYGIGLAIRLSNNFYLKNEFHYHNFRNPDRGDLSLPENVRNTKMWRTSFIMAF